MTATIPHVKLARTRAELPPQRPGCWIVAGTPASEPYPCTCWYSPCDYPKCPDRTRTEGAALPAGCCGRASGSHGERLEGPGGHSNAQTARSSRRRPRENPARSTLGLPESITPAGLARRGAQRPVAAVSGVAGDLWAAPWDAEPPPWDLEEPAPSSDSPDKVSRLATETLEPAGGHSNGGMAVRQHSEPADVRRRLERCTCVTPWDPPPPVLLVAETKDGPVRVAIALDPPRDGERVDLRDFAEELLAARGYGLRGGWKDGRHVLLPPEGRLKTRPGFLAEVFNVAPGLRESALAVIDTPPERGTGIHCADCHISLANRAAHELHKPSWLHPCRPPASIKTVRHGTPMLVRGPNGVWHMNKDAPFGPGGCPVSPAEAASIWRAAQDQLSRSPRRLKHYGKLAR